MATASAPYADPTGRPPLDESFYAPKPEDLQFFKSQTGIENDDELKRHVLGVQKKAYAVHGYPCIRRFTFLELRISRMPAYRSVLELCRSRQDAIFLDVACFFGQHTRRLVADGWPVQNVITIDIYSTFWDLGHELFKTTPETFPATFLPGDVFDPNFLPLDEMLPSTPQAPPPPLASLESLSPLRGHLSAIFASSFFHLFNEEEQANLASRLANLLSPQPGSIIFGVHVGLEKKGHFLGKNPADPPVFCHSPDTWRELWEIQVFKECPVQVEARLVELEKRDHPLLVWSVTRL